jgi:type IV pilus assembly protein PilV
MRTPSEGFSLIEVMIAVLILGLGMLGVAAVQAVALRNGQSALERTQAVIATYSLFDAMRARGGAPLGHYNLASFLCTPPVAGASGAGDDLRRWIIQLKANVHRDACGKVHCTNHECTIDVRWDDSRGTGDSAALATFSIQTRTIL